MITHAQKRTNTQEKTPKVLNSVSAGIILLLCYYNEYITFIILIIMIGTGMQDGMTIAWFESSEVRI